MQDFDRYLITAIHSAVDAGKAILDVYQTDFEVTHKSDDSPLTLADRRSHDIIMKGLAPFNIPVLSEEGRDIPYADRQSWNRLWVVDPLDGTKEFVKRNDEFTVNIALVADSRPVLGVIYVPVKEVLYFGRKEMGAYKLDCRPCFEWLSSMTAPPDQRQLLTDIVARSEKMPIAENGDRPFTIVGSRSHAGPDLQAFVEKKRSEHGHVAFISAGSSMKICLVAEGKADLYPRLGPTSEWDTAAGQAIVESSGGRMNDFNTGQPLVYNKENVLNPWFIVER